VVGDVCGKGVEAAAFTGAVRYALRTAAGLSTAPAAVLGVANATLLREDWSGRFATVVVVRLDLSDGEVHATVSTAGHPPALVRRADGTVHRLEVGGTILGILDDARFAETTVLLDRGDCLVLYTDGVTEAGAPGELFGDVRLESALADAPAAPAAAVATDVVATAEMFRVDRLSAGSPTGERDDMAVLVARVH
jgi:serine phosphatase RsbU (regulator of sigma subunit)